MNLSIQRIAKGQVHVEIRQLGGDVLDVLGRKECRDLKTVLKDLNFKKNSSFIFGCAGSSLLLGLFSD